MITSLVVVIELRYTYTSEDVMRMIEERRAKGAKGFNVAAERMRLSNLREYEAGRGDADAVARCGPCRRYACGSAQKQSHLDCGQHRWTHAVTPGYTLGMLLNQTSRESELDFHLWHECLRCKDGGVCS